MKQKSAFIFLILVCIIVLIVGCTSNSNNSAAVTTTQTITPISTTIKPTTILSTIATTATVVPTTTSTLNINNQVMVSPDVTPHMVNLKFVKNIFPIPINNCPMQEAFPNIAKDSSYGLLQNVPKITGLSAGEYNKFLREYTEGSADTTRLVSISRCEGAVKDPKWNFVEVSAKIMATNARPTNYTISLNVRSHGKIIAQFKSPDQLTLDNIVTYTSYIPLKVNEMDEFDSIEVAYEKQLN